MTTAVLTRVGTPYEEFRYFPPPQTSAKKSPEFLPLHERMGHWGQLKLNGSHSEVYLGPDRIPDAWNRHGERHRRWRFDDHTGALFRSLPGKKWFVFDGELMHAKTPGIKNIHYLYDVLVYDGVHLTRTTYAERYKLLKGLFRSRAETIGHYELDDYTWLAKNHTEHLSNLFEATREFNPTVEGLMVKDPNGMYYSGDARAWMIKFRHRG